MPDTDHDVDDGPLWRRVRGDDADAFGLLFARHGGRIHRYVLRRTADPQLAEDITAIVFLEAWRKRASVELTQPSALPWLYGVAGNVLRHQRRTRRRHQDLVDSVAQLPSRSPALVESQAQAAADAAVVLEQVRGLPRRERDVLVLAAWEGLSHAEIAEALGISPGRVKSRLFQARSRLDPDRAPTRPPAGGPLSPPRPPTTNPTRSPMPLALEETRR